MGRLGDEDGVRGFWESDSFVIGCFGEFEVFIFSIVKNALNHDRDTLNLKTPGYE